MSDNRRDVSFQSVDGVTLKGWFFSAASKPGPCIIMTHGVCSESESILGHLASLIKMRLNNT